MHNERSQPDQGMIVTEAAGDPPSLALALGGGGGKAGAHLGVLAVLESIGAPIDMIVGTSIGGTVGVLYAAGYTIPEISQALQSSTVWRLLDRDPTGRGMLGGRWVRSLLEEMLGECTFDNLGTPAAVVATDLVSGQQVVLDSGPLVEALMATMALPGVFPPVSRGDLLLADGGIVNNLPVSVAYARGASKVIAVDLGNVCDNFQVGPLSGAGGRLSLLPSAPLTIANRGLSVLMAQLTRYQLAETPPDLLLCPQVEHIGLLDLSRLDEGRRAGEEAALQALDRLQALCAWRSGSELAPLECAQPQLAQRMAAA